MKILIEICKRLLAVLLGIFLSSCTFFYVAHKISTLPDIYDIQDFDNVSNDLPKEEQDAIKKSRKSTVRVFSKGVENGVSVSWYLQV